MGNFAEVDLQKSYAQAKGKYDEAITNASRSHHIGRKVQALKNTFPPPGFNIAPAKDPSITSVISNEADEDEYDSLLGGASLYLDPEGDYISLLGDEASLTGFDVYQPGDASIGASNARGHTSTSKVK